jgi:fatty acid-binding protein DegV
MRRAIQKIAEIVEKFHPEGSELRVQLLHGKNPEGLVVLKEAMQSRFKCHFTPTATVGPILGAHTGGGLIGLSVGPHALFKEVPGVVIEG